MDDSNGYPAWLYIDQQGPVCHVRTENLYKTGTITYRLTVYTPEGWSDSHEFTVNVEEMPENLPTALDVESEVYLDVGDTYTFRLEDVEFADGEVPEGASVRVSVPGIDDLDIVRENYFEWHEDGNGFDVTFDHNGRYVFDVCKQVGNHMVYAEVHIYVGTGLDENAYAFCEQYVYNVYENGGNDVFIGVANVDNYELFTGETVWTLERIDSECTSEAMLYFHEDGGYVELYANTLDNCGTGVIRYNLTADLGGENVWSFPIQVMVDEMPENLPTALAMPEEPMVFTVGDSAEINYQDFGFAEGYVPEDAFVRSWLIGIEDTDLWHCNEVSYDVQNMYINFFSAGEYVVEVTRTINNYAVKGELTIIVNEPEIFVEAYQAYNTLYLGADETGNADTWVADAYLQNLWLEEGEAIEWSLEPIGLEDGAEPIMELYIEEGTEWDEGRGINIHYSSLTKLLKCFGNFLFCLCFGKTL